MNIPEGMRQEAVVVGGIGGDGLNILAWVEQEMKDPSKKVVVENGNAYIFGPKPK